MRETVTDAVAAIRNVTLARGNPTPRHTFAKTATKWSCTKINYGGSWRETKIRAPLVGHSNKMGWGPIVI